MRRGSDCPDLRIYTVTYENEGDGRSCGVFVVDQPDPALDLSTLTIYGPSELIAENRTILWTVGELGPKGGSDSSGVVSFTVELPGARDGDHQPGDGALSDGWGGDADERYGQRSPAADGGAAAPGDDLHDAGGGHAFGARAGGRAAFVRCGGRAAKRDGAGPRVHAGQECDGTR